MHQGLSNLSVPAESRLSLMADAASDELRGPTAVRVPPWLSLSSWPGRLIWLAVLIGPIWLLDQPLAAAKLHEKNIVLAGDIRDVTRQFGEPMGIAWMSLVLWFLDRSRRRPLVVAIVATLIAAGLGSGTKLLVGRERPKVSEGRTILHGPHWPGTMKPDASFPSGHAAVAFAFAFGMGRLYPRHRALWVFLAAGCGLSRAFGDAHYLTDVVVGAWMGWESARLFWESRTGGWLMARLDRRIPDAGWFPRWNCELAGNSPSTLATIAQGGA